MGLNIDFTKGKVSASYKTLYLKNELIEKIDSLAKENDTSFNNIVASMIEYCIKEGYNS